MRLLKRGQFPIQAGAFATVKVVSPIWDLAPFQPAKTVPHAARFGNASKPVA
jgi:hypothetical protein